MTKKLQDIIDAPKPTEEELRTAEEAGADWVGWDPDRVRAFMAGKITLGDLEGIDKEAQYRMAQVAYKHFTEGKMEQAKQAFQGLLALDPFDAYFLTVLGAIAQEEGKHEEAEAAYSRALEINPFSAVAWAQRGETRILLGKLSEAADDITRALEEDPEGKEPATQRARAMAIMLRKELEKAQASVAATASSAADAGDPSASNGSSNEES